jgi:hypothetical protein
LQLCELAFRPIDDVYLSDVISFRPTNRIDNFVKVAIESRVLDWMAFHDGALW